MSSSLPPPTDAEPARHPPWPRSHLVAMFVFGAIFLTLLIAFRSVLFPFLMAIYLAYLVEPVVGWATQGKVFGLHWGRAPVLIFLYVVVIGLLVLGVSCGAQKLVDNATRAGADLKRELDKTAPAARIHLSQNAPRDVWIPAGIELASGPEARWKTMFPEQINEGLQDVRVLLAPIGKDAVMPGVGGPLEVVDAKPLGLPPEIAVTATADKTAKGLELGTKRWLIAPVAEHIEKKTGSHFDPGLLKAFIDEQSDKHGAELGQTVVGFSQGLPVRLAGSVYEVILVLMLTAFIVIDRRRIAAFFESLPPPTARPRYRALMRYVDRGLAGVIRGQLVICLVNGTLTWLGLLILGVPYATLLGFIAGVFSLIPVFGTIASSIPIVLVALAAGGLQAALLALAWIGLIHLLEANVFNPLIMGTNAEMHPVIIIFALLAGEHAFGIWGALLAVPTASIIQSAFKFYRHEILGVPDAEPHGHGLWMRRLLARWKGRGSGAAPGGAA